MNTIDKIKEQAQDAMNKSKSGIPLSNTEIEILRIYNSIFSKKAGNSGKRKPIKTGK